MQIKARTLSQLPETKYNSSYNQNGPTLGSYMELSKRLSEGDKVHFISNKISLSDLISYIGEGIINNFMVSLFGLKKNDSVAKLTPIMESSKHLERDLSGKTNFSLIQDSLYNLYYRTCTIYDGIKKFAKRPEITDSRLSSFTDAVKDKVVDIKTLSAYNNETALNLINGNFDFATYYFNPEAEQDIQLSTENLVWKHITKDGKDVYYPDNMRAGTLRNGVVGGNISFGMSEDDIKDNHYNEWIFRIPNNSRQSNNWVAPASGMFTCFGWLDEKDGSYASNALRWVALEAYNEEKDEWHILQLQPFSPNEFCSYVGFSFPVRAGLMLRIKTGFTVGTNSDKYHSLVGSMSNHIANAFIGGVYTLDANQQTMYQFNYYENLLSAWKRQTPTVRDALDIICNLSSSLSDNFQDVYLDLLATDTVKRTKKNEFGMYINNWHNGTNANAISNYINLESRNTLSSLIVHALQKLSADNNFGFGELNNSSNEYQKLYFYRTRNTGTIEIEFNGDFSGTKTGAIAYIAYAEQVNGDATTYKLRRINRQFEVMEGVEATEHISLPLKRGQLLAFQAVKPININTYGKMPHNLTKNDFEFLSPSSTGYEQWFARITESYNVSPEHAGDWEFFQNVPDSDVYIPDIDVGEQVDWTGDINALRQLILQLQTELNATKTTVTNNYNTLNSKLNTKVGYYNGTVLAAWNIATLPKNAGTYDGMTLESDGNMPYTKDTKYPNSAYKECRRINGGYYYFKVPVDGTYQIALDPENGATSGKISGTKPIGIARVWLKSDHSSYFWKIRQRKKVNGTWQDWPAWSTISESNDCWQLIGTRIENMNGNEDVSTYTLNLKAGSVLIFSLWNHVKKSVDFLLGTDGFGSPIGLADRPTFWRHNHYSSTTTKTQYIRYQKDSSGAQTNVTTAEEITGLLDSSVCIVTSSDQRKNNNVHNFTFARVSLLAKN